jgi:hypothetical protein
MGEYLIAHGQAWKPLKMLVECRMLYHDEVLGCVERAMRDMKAASLRVDRERRGTLGVVSGFVKGGGIRLELKVLVETTERVVDKLRSLGRIKVSCVSAEARCRGGCAGLTVEASPLQELISRVSSHLMSKRAGG